MNIYIIRHNFANNRRQKKAGNRSVFQPAQNLRRNCTKRISPRDIHSIIKEEEARRQKYEHQQQQQEISAQAYKLFSEGKTPIEVAIILNLPASKVSKLYREYWDLKGLDQLNTIFKETNGKLGPFLKLYKELIKKRRMSIEQVVNNTNNSSA